MLREIFAQGPRQRNLQPTLQRTRPHSPAHSPRTRQRTRPHSPAHSPAQSPAHLPAHSSAHSGRGQAGCGLDRRGTQSLDGVAPLRDSLGGQIGSAHEVVRASAGYAGIWFIRHASATERRLQAAEVSLGAHAIKRKAERRYLVSCHARAYLVQWPSSKDSNLRAASSLIASRVKGRRW
jgi:hypothetical protein